MIKGIERHANRLPYSRRPTISREVRENLLYMRNGNFRVCLLANFGEAPLGKERKVHTPAGAALYGPHP